jgi:uncharacterized protein
VAPLELATARGRSAELFGFEFIWEVYKPASERRYGYYVLPVLYGDRLVGRIDLKLDRPAASLRVLGFWTEEPKWKHDTRFAEALGRGLGRLADFHRATDVSLGGVRPAALRQQVARAVRSARRIEVPSRSATSSRRSGRRTTSPSRRTT